MTSPVEMFFAELAGRGHVPWLEHEHGRIRLEVVDADCIRHWTVAFDDGDVEVSQGESDADAVVRADHDLVERIARGEANVLAATLRGEIVITGTLELLAQMGRLLPGPPGQMGPRRVGGAGRRTG
jgi:hypothetical protein